MLGRDVVVLAEVADVLAQHGGVRCAMDVEHEDGQLTLTLTIPTRLGGTRFAESDDRLVVLSLRDELVHLANAATLRALAERFGIPSEQLEPYLTKERT